MPTPSPIGWSSSKPGTSCSRGTLAEVTAHPRSRYIAELVGLNLITGDLTGTMLTAPGGACVVTADHPGDGPAYVAIRPQAVSLHRHRPESSARNVWRLTVDDVDQLHDRTGSPSPVTSRSSPRSPPPP